MWSTKLNRGFTSVILLLLYDVRMTWLSDSCFNDCIIFVIKLYCRNVNVKVMNVKVQPSGCK